MKEMNLEGREFDCGHDLIHSQDGYQNHMQDESQNHTHDESQNPISVQEEGFPPVHSHPHNHSHTHDPEEIKKISNRLARAAGHLKKVQQMVEDNCDCAEVLVQLSAVIGALNSTGRQILKHHIDHCIVHAVMENDQEAIEELNRAIDTFLK